MISLSSLKKLANFGGMTKKFTQIWAWMRKVRLFKSIFWKINGFFPKTSFWTLSFITIRKFKKLVYHTLWLFLWNINGFTFTSVPCSISLTNLMSYSSFTLLRLRGTLSIPLSAFSKMHQDIVFSYFASNSNKGIGGSPCSENSQINLGPLSLLSTLWILTLRTSHFENGAL